MIGGFNLPGSPPPSSQPQQPASAPMTPEEIKRREELAVDLADLLKCVWEAEGNWKFDDLLAVRAASEGW